MESSYRWDERGYLPMVGLVVYWRAASKWRGGSCSDSILTRMSILNYNYLGRALVLVSLAAYSIAAAWFGQYRFALVGLVIMAVFVVYMVLDTRRGN